MRFFVIILILIGIVVFTGCTADTAGSSATPIAETGMPTPEDEMLSGKAGTLLKLARVSRDSGDIPAALRLYEQAMASPGAGVEPVLEMASLYRDRMNEPARAVGVLTTASTSYMDDAGTLKRIARELVNSGGTSQALALYDQALSQQPGNVDLINGKGVTLDMLGRHAEAQAIYQGGLGQSANDPALSNNLALSHILQEDFERAINVLQPLADTTSDERIHQNLALAYGLHGDLDKAYAAASPHLTPKQVNDNIAFYQKFIDEKRQGSADDERFTHRPHPVIDRVTE